MGLIEVSVKDAKRGLNKQCINPLQFMGFKNWFENGRSTGVMFFTEISCQKGNLFVPDISTFEIKELCEEAGIKVVSQKENNLIK
jgi:hypothetical protein